MEISNRHAKLSFAAFTAFLLVFFVISLPQASAQTAVGISPPEEIGPGHRLYKYLHHVPVTEYEWPAGYYDYAKVRFSPSPTAPTTDHLLWKKQVCKLFEGLWQNPLVINGKVIIGTNSAKSVYPGVTHALDQNTGEIMWSYPASDSNMIKLDDTHMLIGTTCVNPQDGSVQWDGKKLARSISFYVPELKMGFGTGPYMGLTGRGETVMAWDFSDLSKPPEEVWTSGPWDDASASAYDNGKIFVGGGDSHDLRALDAKTGNELWFTLKAGGSSARINCVGNGKVFVSSWRAFHCYDQETGEHLWMGTLGHQIGNSALGYGKVYVFETRTYFWCFDVNDGHPVWKYLAMRQVPHWCGASAPGDCNHTEHHIAYYNCVLAAGKIYATTMQKTTYPTLLPPNYEGYEYEGVRYWVNPNPFPVISHCGENEFVCFDAETGKVIWRVGLGWPYGANAGTEANPAYIGPDCGHPVVADGKVYATEQPYSGHTGIGESRKECDPLARWDISEPKFHISNVWYPGNVYCFGPGPSEMTATTNTAKVQPGEAVTISGTVTDLSPATPGTPAAKVPIVLTWSKPDGTKGEIALVTTDNDGMFSYTWTPWITGQVSIHLESDGGDSYESPNTVTLPVTVESAMDLMPMLEGGLMAAVVGATLPIIYNRKTKAAGETE